ncbi:MAG TPA: hypothetical protein VF730_00120 [Terracidiphilus sp.]
MRPINFIQRAARIETQNLLSARGPDNAVVFGPQVQYRRPYVLEIAAHVAIENNIQTTGQDTWSHRQNGGLDSAYK